MCLSLFKRLIKTNQDVIDQQCIRNDDRVLAFSDKDQKIVLKSYHEKLLSTEFAQDRNSLSW